MTRARHILLTADAVGGVWQYSTGLAAALLPLGHEVTLAVLGPAPDEAQRAGAAAIADLRLMQTGLDLEWLADEPDRMIGAERRLAEMAGDLRADIVQVHSPALAGAGCYPCPVVAVLHSCVATWWSAVRGGPPPQDFAWRTALVEKGLRQATLSIAPSMAFAAAARRQYGVAPVPVHNGRTLPVQPQAAQDCIFTAGRLWDAGKNVHVLDEAASHLSVPFKAAGPTRSPHGESVAFGTLHLLGVLDEAALARHLGARPIFVSAALYEPFGLAVLEAAIAGCPLILSDIPTFRELWNGAALFVDPRDPRAFARAIEGLIEDRAARAEAGRRARERAQRYTPAAMAGRMAALYDQVQSRAAA